MKGQRKGLCGLKLCLILLVGMLHTMILANDPTSIKVGLESIYNNKSNIVLKSDQNFDVGFFEVDGFRRVGIINANELNISKKIGAYYDAGYTTASFSEAQAFAAAYGNGAVPVCVAEDIYKVYAMNEEAGRLTDSLERLIVCDENNNIMLISECSDILFRGYDIESGLALTTVGQSKQYRGAIGIAGTTGLTPYNELFIEEYLYGVVPKEMSPSWPIEALKAQAVAARSIALNHYNRFLSRGYNVVDTVTTQAYGGYLAEHETTNAAVNETKGKVIKYNGQVAEALYFSTSGGATEDAKYVWGSEIPYLKSVVDTYEVEPAQKAWTREISLSEINRCLASVGADIGKAKGVQITSRTNSGRVLELTILGSSGNYVVKNEKVRTFFSSTSGGSLKSRLFSFTDTLADSVHSGSTSDKAQTVSILSANNMTSLPSSGLTVLSANSLGTLGNSFAVQSAEAMQNISNTEQVVSNNLTTETVWGDLTISGLGYGHGVGMSQSGAKGMAKAGFNYDEILNYYYSGISIE